MLTKVVVRSPPPNLTTELFMKFVPLTVRVKAISPAVLLVGEILIRVGTGLGCALTVKLTEFTETEPVAGLKTVIGNIPAEATSSGRISAVNWVELTKLVKRSLPFHCTNEPFAKPVPFTVKVNPPRPAFLLEGESVVITAGAGNTTLRKTISLLPVAPVLAAAMIPVLGLTSCFVEVGFDDPVMLNTQGKSKERLSMFE